MSQANIIAGPDRFMLTRLFDGSNIEQPLVTFVLERQGEKWEERIKLNSAEREDGSGFNWNLNGFQPANRCYVKIFYNLRRHTGHFEFLTDEPPLKVVKPALYNSANLHGDIQLQSQLSEVESHAEDGHGSEFTLKLRAIPCLSCWSIMSRVRISRSHGIFTPKHNLWNYDIFCTHCGEENHLPNYLKDYKP